MSQLMKKIMMIEATITAGEAQVPVTAAGLKGKKLQFSIEREFGSLAAPVQFTGEVDGDRISGKFRCKTHSGNWTAKRMR